MALAAALSAMQTLSVNFTLLHRPFACLPDTSLNNSVAGAADLSLALNFTAGEDACVSAAGCQRLAFTDSQMKVTALETFRLVCDRQYLATVVKVMFMLGFLAGSTCYGLLSDRCGRQGAFAVAVVNLAIAGSAAALSKDAATYAALRCLAGFASAGLLSVSYTWHAETLHNADRFFLSLLMKNGWSLGLLALAGVAWWTRDWRTTELLASGPALLLLPPALLFAAESPRWLLSRGRFGAAETALRRIARVNRTTSRLQRLLERRPMRQQSVARGVAGPTAPADAAPLQLLDRSSPPQADAPSGMPLLSLLRRPALRQLALSVWSTFAVVSAGYYGLALGWTDLLSDGGGGGAFSGAAMAAGVEIVARLVGIAAGSCCGRVSLLLAANSVGAVSLIGLASVGAPLGFYGRLAAALSGRFGLLLAFESAWLHASEAFPTSARNSCVGVASTSARVGGVVAAQLGLLAGVWRPLPPLLCGLLAGAGCCLALFLPETRQSRPPDTLDEAEQLCAGGRLVDRLEASLGTCRTAGRQAGADAAAQLANDDHSKAAASGFRIPELRLNSGSDFGAAANGVGCGRTGRGDVGADNSNDDSSRRISDFGPDFSDLSDSSSVSHLATRGSNDPLEIQVEP